MNRPPTKTAYVLMTDRVGFSKLPVETKARLDKELLDAVLTCPSVVGRGEDECIRLDSGDGVALVFFDDPISALEAANYLHEQVARSAEVKLRIGLHSGLVTRRIDANGKSNVSGPGIDKAQRAMSCADGSRIVMSEFFAENLRAFEAWRDRLVDLGEQTIKHGEKIRLYALSEGSSETDPDGKIAIIYRRKAQPDDAVLEMLERRLPEHGFTVFIDRHLSIGVKWAQQIEREIRSANAVIILLSEKSAVSEMVLFELQTAIDQRETGGYPIILPIRIGRDEPVEGDIGALLKPYHYGLWRSPQDDDALIADVVRALREPESAKERPPLERVGGAMPTDSPFYIDRRTDREFRQAILDRDSIVLVKGGRQIGKTSLMARALRAAETAGAKVVWTDFQSYAKAQFETDERLFLALAGEFTAQLGLDDDPLDHWREILGPNTNFERFLLRTVMAKVKEPIVWALDEVDRLFTMPYSSDFFGMIRSWHNRRAARAEEAWSRFTVALAYATEAHLFISDLNQSPFNVGTRLELADFDSSQVSELNERYGSPLSSEAEVSRLHDLLGGQPYLTRRGLDEMVRHGLPLRELVEHGTLDEGPFGDHLRRLLVALSGDAHLLDEVRSLCRGGGLTTEESFFRLRSGGIVRGSHLKEAHFRCQIYETYLSRHLG